MAEKQMRFETYFAVGHRIMELFVLFVVLANIVGCGLNYLRGFLAEWARGRLASERTVCY